MLVMTQNKLTRLFSCSLASTPPPPTPPSCSGDGSTLLDNSVFAHLCVHNLTLHSKLCSAFPYIYLRRTLIIFANLIETGVARVIWFGHSSGWFAMLELTVLLLSPTSTSTSTTSTLCNISMLALQGDFRIHFTAHCIYSQYGCTEYLSIRMKVLQVIY